MDLSELGWSDRLSEHLGEVDQGDSLPARVISESAHIYSIFCDKGELKAEVSGKLTHQASGKKDFPVVGDWVAIKLSEVEQKSTINSVLPRKSAFIRKEAGKRTQGQVIAANIDTVFLVCGLDGDLNPDRIERYLTVAWESGAKPVVVLNKTDVCADVAGAVETVQSLAIGVSVLPVCAIEITGIDLLREHIHFGKTVAFIGSSGVGKSSLINALLGEARQKVQEVRGDDSRGRHTTARGELFVLPEGGVLMDTPGLRELQLWSDGDGLAQVFDDIEELAEKCRFKDCRHDQEPECAVKQGLDDGTLDARRWQSYVKLKSEQEYIAGRQDKAAKMANKKQQKDLSKHIRNVNKRPRK